LRCCARFRVWFHTFALNRALGFYTPGLARDHRYRMPFLPQDFHGAQRPGRRHLRRLLRLPGRVPRGRAGSGVDNEQYVHMVKERFGAEAAGGQAFRAISRLLGSSVEYRTADALDLAGSAEGFDFIFCCGMLHRVEIRSACCAFCADSSTPEAESCWRPTG